MASLFQRKLDLAPTATIDKVALNNTVVGMRAVVKRARLFVINELVKKIHKLRKRKGSEAVQSKNKNKADRLLEEIKILKNLKPDYVSKYALGSTEKFEVIVVKESSNLDMRAVARLAQQKFIQEQVANFRSEHSDWKELAAFLMTKHTSREFKKKKTKEKMKKVEANVKVSETLVKKYLSEKLEGKEIESDLELDSEEDCEKDTDSDRERGKEDSVVDLSSSNEDRKVGDIKSSDSDSCGESDNVKLKKNKENISKVQGVDTSPKQSKLTVVKPVQTKTNTEILKQNLSKNKTKEMAKQLFVSKYRVNTLKKTCDSSSGDDSDPSGSQQDNLLKHRSHENPEDGSDSESGDDLRESNDDDDDDDDEIDDDDDFKDDVDDNNRCAGDSSDGDGDDDDYDDDDHLSDDIGDKEADREVSKRKILHKEDRPSKLLKLSFFTKETGTVESDSNTSESPKKKTITEKVEGEMIVRKLDLSKDFGKEEIPAMLLNQHHGNAHKQKKRKQDVFFADSDEDSADDNDTTENIIANESDIASVNNEKKSRGSFERSIEPTMSSFTTTFLGSLNSDEMMSCTDSKYRSNEEWKRLRHERKEQQYSSRGRGRGGRYQQGLGSRGRGGYSNRGERGGFKGSHRGPHEDAGRGARRDHHGRGFQSGRGRGFRQDRGRGMPGFSGPHKDQREKQTMGQEMDRKDSSDKQSPAPRRAEGLHPSWEASKKRKQSEKNVLQAFTGKKIKFDE